MNNTKEISGVQLSNSMQPEEFDLVILGGGTGSTVAAWTFAGEGKRVAVIDRKYIGGSCPNIACLPSKKHHPQREGRVLRSPKQRVWDHSQRLRNRHVGRPRAQT
jgi:glycine/D-amino acid oxidase-like deaminating enzyme